MGLFPRPGAHDDGARESDGGLMAPLRIQAARHRRRHRRGRDRRLARQGRRRGRGGPAARRHDDRQGDGRDGKPGRRQGGRSWRARSATRSPIGSVLVVIETEGDARPRRRRTATDEAAARPTARSSRRPAMAEEIPYRGSRRAQPAPRREPASLPPRSREADRPRRASTSRPRRQGRSPRPPSASARRDLGIDLAQVKTDRRPRPPRRSRRLPALQRRQRLSPRQRRAARRRDDQGHRPAPQDRREHAGGEAPHPAFHLGRGIRRHRARGHARDDERAIAATIPS